MAEGQALMCQLFTPKLFELIKFESKLSLHHAL